MQGVGLGPRIRHPHRQQQVVRVALGVVGLDDPVAIVVEGAGVEQLVLRIELAAAGVLGDEVAVGERSLRIVVAPAVPGVAREGVEVPPVLLRILAVVALAAGQPEDPLLQDRVAAIPERESEAEPLLDVREAGQTVLAPAIGARAGVVVRQVVPGGAAGAVVLAHGAPLPLAQVGAPQVPVTRLPQTVLEPAEGLDPVALGAHGDGRRPPRRSAMTRRSRSDAGPDRPSHPRSRSRSTRPPLEFPRATPQGAILAKPGRSCCQWRLT